MNLGRRQHTWIGVTEFYGQSICALRSIREANVQLRDPGGQSDIDSPNARHAPGRRHTNGRRLEAAQKPSLVARGKPQILVRLDAPQRDARKIQPVVFARASVSPSRDNPPPRSVEPAALLPGQVCLCVNYRVYTYGYASVFFKISGANSFTLAFLARC